MKSRSGPQQQPGPIPAPQQQRFQAEEYKDEGESLGLDAADQPFAGQVAVLDQRRDQGGRDRRKPAPRCHGETQSPPCPSQQAPSQHPAGPCQGCRPQPPRQPAEGEIEDPMRVGRVEEEIVRGPSRIPEMDRLAQVVGLVHVRAGHCALREEDGKDEDDLGQGLPALRGGFHVAHFTHALRGSEFRPPPRGRHWLCQCVGRGRRRKHWQSQWHASMEALTKPGAHLRRGPPDRVPGAFHVRPSALRPPPLLSF